MKRFVLIGVVGLSLLAGPWAASAETTPSPDAPTEGSGVIAEIGGVAIEEGADETLVIPEEEIADSREEAVVEAETDGLSAEAEDVVEKLVDISTEEGGTLEPEDVDVFEVLDGDVEVAVPVTTVIDEIVVDIEDTSVEIEASSSEAEEETLASDGPGLAAPYWRGDGDGQYVIRVKGWGDSVFTWARAKLINDGSNTYSWFSYRRKGDAQPTNRNNAPDARVSRLRVQSYPYDSIEKYLVNWNEWDPATNFSGDCNSSSITVGITVLGVGVSTSFRDCDSYKMWRNPDNPGSYWLEMDQGTSINSGNRQVGYVVAWKQKGQSTPGSQHDFQRVRWFLSGSSRTCDNYDAGKTCVP